MPQVPDRHSTAQVWLSGLDLTPTEVPEADGSLTALATELDLHGNLDAMVRAVAHWLRDLHAIDPADAPLPTGWEALGADIDAAVASGALDGVELPDPYGRYTPARLAEIWRESQPASEGELVLCHGLPTLGAFTVSVVEPVAVIEIADRGSWRVANRHHDLAVIQQSVHRHLGAEAVFLFYEAYGSTPDIVQLDHHVLGSLLLHGPSQP